MNTHWILLKKWLLLLLLEVIFDEVGLDNELFVVIGDDDEAIDVIFNVAPGVVVVESLLLLLLL